MHNATQHYLFSLTALHAIRGNNTSIVSSAWWWAYKCPKHVEQIRSVINHSVASSWFSSLSLYNYGRTNIHQIHILVCIMICALLISTLIHSADKSLAQPGTKQPNVSVRMAWISFGALSCRKKNYDSSRLDVVEIACVPNMLPSLFPS